MKTSAKTKSAKRVNRKAQRAFNLSGRLVTVLSVVFVMLAAAGVGLYMQRNSNAASTAADTGAKVTREKWIDSRTVDLSIASPSIDSATKNVRVIMPKDWSKGSTRSWPSLWLLHGGYGSYMDWPKNTDIAKLASDHDLMVVMPDTSWCSAYSNWWNYGKYGKPAWDTFLTTEVRQILERGYRANTSRAIAGPSMGGLGALKLSAGHPGMFAATASFSGNADPLHSYNNTKDGPDLPGLACAADWKRVWGDYKIPAQKAIWQKNNPYDQAQQLAGSKFLYISSGDGLSNPLRVGLSPDPAEQQVNKESQALAAKLQGLNIPVTTHFYGGSHSWPYWQAELHTAFPEILKALGTK